jgi:hypothetical protein
MQLPPTQYYVFGEHALNYVKDEALADSLFRRAVERSAEHPDLIAAMVEDLLGKGRPAQAKAVADHARERGIANVELPADALDQPASTPEPGT